jgi:hypothetical protein
VSQTWLGATSACSSNLTFQLFRHHHLCAAVGLALQITHWYHKTRLHIQTTHTYRDATSVAESGSKPIHMQLKFYRSTVFHHHHVLRWDWRQIHLWYHKTKFFTKLPTPSQGRNQCCRRGSGPIRHMQLKFYRSNFPPPPPCAAVGLAFRSTLWYHKTRLSHQTTPIRDTNQCCGLGPIHMQLKFYRSNVPQPPPCVLRWDCRIHPLVP